jgi:hypothetical protein
MTWWNKKPKKEPETEESFQSGYACLTNHHVLRTAWAVSPTPKNPWIVCPDCGDCMKPAVLRIVEHAQKGGWLREVPLSVEFVRYLDEPKPEKKPKSVAQYELWLIEVEKYLRRSLYRTEMCLAAGLYTQPSTAKDAAAEIRRLRGKK